MTVIAPLPYRVRRVTPLACVMVGCFESLAEALAFREEWERLDDTARYELIDDGNL